MAELGDKLGFEGDGDGYIYPNHLEDTPATVVINDDKLLNNSQFKNIVRKYKLK